VKNDIIVLSVSSSGQSGPDSHFAGYAPLFGAWGALGTLTGYADGPPVEIRHVMDHTVGLNAAVAFLAALHHRRATGEGQHVDVAAREVASSLVGEALLLAAAGIEPQRMGNEHPRMAPHGVYPAKGNDCWITIAVSTDAEWRALAQAMGKPQLADDARFANPRDRHGHRGELDGIIGQWTQSLEANATAELLQARGIAAHASWTAREAVSDPHLRARHAIVDVKEPDGRPRAAIGVPVWMSKGEDIGIQSGTPKLGEHEDYVFGSLLGLSRRERQALEDEEVIH
jgi:crotonobetainyl-CoA:carnitine CoA-transferase CaiB-like acyl-CoA transferase